MKEKLNACYERLQQLDIPPTLSNMEKLVQTLYDIRDVYNELENKEREEGNGRPQTGPEK